MRLGTVLVNGRATTVADRAGALVDLCALSPHVPVGRALVAAWEAGDAEVRNAARAAMTEAVPALPTLDPAAVTWLPPIPDARTVFAVGLNYLSHCREQGQSAPAEPLFFTKLPSSYNGHMGDVVAWPLTQELDYEGELAVVIGRGGRAIPEADALSRCFGYTVMADFTARDLQRRDRQWTRAKGLDSFAPFGPFVATRDEVPDPSALRIVTTVDGEVVQDAPTSEMTFGVARLVSYLSQAITLRPGDVITTGTPAGVGVFAKPPRFLVPGNEVRVRIDGIGELVNRVVPPPPQP
jgi:2-keto-4-pentenoate hydratase/2-oxohepta-3-ene-1,7-dioic acid hydratase in catechol pathway